MNDQAAILTRRRLSATAAGLIAALACVAPALADDTEIFVNQSSASGVRPNVLFIVDTSGSMNSAVAVTKLPYDSAQTYGGSCDAGFVYFSRGSSGSGGSNVPACTGSGVRSIAVALNECRASITALDGLAGFWTGKAARWQEANVRWRSLQAGADEDQPVECQADSGSDGATVASAQTYARNGNATNPWSSSSGEELDWNSQDVHTFYSANYLNWYYGPNTGGTLSRLDTVKAVGTALAYSIDNVNLGLMRFSTTPGSDGAEGGMVTHEIANVSTARNSIATRLDAYQAQGFTPLSETLYEAGQYLAGRAVDYGLNSQIEGGQSLPSVPESRDASDDSQYRSPIEFQCQKNYVVLLTDGEPTRDQSADAAIEGLPEFGSLVGGSCTGTGDGRCLDDMAEYMFKKDLSPSLAGEQNAITYTIGFGPDVAGSTFLETVASRGGGKAYSANNVSELTDVLQRLFGEILQSSTTFTSPSVSINAFNRTQSTNELFVSVFRPKDSLRWPGNVKKYGIRDGQIVDAANAAAVDPTTGFFRAGSRSIWSVTADENRVELGGAASRLPAPASRNLYTHLASSGTAALTATANDLSASNAALTDAVLNTGGAGPTRAELLDWVRGVDVQDADGDGDRAEALRTIGDPLHARPAVITYGGTTGSPNLRDQVVFVPTNDGFLHAIDADNGSELWGFMPEELLGRAIDLYRDPTVSARTYGLDGDVRVLKFDVNQDGVVDSAAGDRVWIFFGMRRGGRSYYALDVTNRLAPRLKWSIGPTELPGIGETWSTPTLARVRVQGASQNGENLVLIFGGGYDDAQENYGFTADSSGNRIFMVDASSGALLWSAGSPTSPGSPDLQLASMTNSIPGRVVALDTDGDQYADRMYAADMGGRILRFDIYNGQARSSLVTGGVFAALGSGDTGATNITQNRRFYYAPDVALIQRRGADPYYNIAIGSGYRGHPLHTETRDRFYSIRDKSPFARFTQAQYNTATPLLDSNLVDITDNLVSASVGTSASGWKLEMRLNGGWTGEKILSESLTVDGTILFTSYQPVALDPTNPCLPATGRNRAYALRIDSGKPAIDYNDDGAITAADAFTQLAQAGIAGGVSIGVESVRAREANGEVIDPNGVDAVGRRAFCVVGVEVLQRCVVPGSVVRTYWQRSANNQPE